MGEVRLPESVVQPGLLKGKEWQFSQLISQQKSKNDFPRLNFSRTIFFPKTKFRGVPRTAIASLTQTQKPVGRQLIRGTGAGGKARQVRRGPRAPPRPKEEIR